jgi:hypothetical protein
MVLKAGGLNLLEPSGPVYACDGVALPFIFKFTKMDGDSLILNAFVIYKTEPSSCFSCKTDTFGSYKIGAICYF